VKRTVTLFSLAVAVGFACKSTTNVTLHGSVHDYRGQPVGGASVTGKFRGQGSLAMTNATGHFELNVDPGTYITATKADMPGSVTVGPERDQTVVITMAQMPK
jgi:hypothetical protein